jgi:WD40 repeat protein
MEAFNFTVANEDHNLYSFDMRKLDQATCVHMDHVGAVLDIDYSPTGQEFVSGSYDRTLRIFPRSGLAGAGHAREIYHTRRMQVGTHAASLIVTAVAWHGYCERLNMGSIIAASVLCSLLDGCQVRDLRVG